MKEFCLKTRQRRKPKRNQRLTVRSFKCSSGCARAFASYSALKYHESLAHSGPRFRCLWIMCRHTADSEEALALHEVQGHPSLQKLNILNSQHSIAGLGLS